LTRFSTTTPRYSWAWITEPSSGRLSVTQ
jgi:hypothetical protein